MGHIILGIGGTGQKVLTHLKHMFTDALRDRVALLSLDTVSPDKYDNYTVAGTFLEKDREYFYLADTEDSLVELRAGRLHPNDAQVFKQNFRFEAQKFKYDLVTPDILNSDEGAGMHRQIAASRILINSDEIAAKLRALADNLPDDKINVWIVGSLAGGTGAGALIPLGALARLATQGLNKRVNVRAVAVLTETYKKYVDGVSKGRGFAVLREMDYIREVGAEMMDHLFVQPLNSGPYHELFEFRGNKLYRPGTLFDSYSYIDRVCEKKEETASLLQEVGNTMRLFVDDDAATEIAQALVNASAANAILGIDTPVPTYGFHEILVPADDIARLFALQKANELAKKLAPPNKELTGFRGIARGSDDPAAAALTEMHKLFPSLAELNGLNVPPSPGEEQEAVIFFLQDRMHTAKAVVNKLFDINTLVSKGLAEPGRAAFERVKSKLSPDALTVEEKRNAKPKQRVGEPANEKRDFKSKIDQARKSHLGKNGDGGELSDTSSFNYNRHIILNELRKVIEIQIGNQFIAQRLGRSWKGNENPLEFAHEVTNQLTAIANDSAIRIQTLAELELLHSGVNNLDNRSTHESNAMNNEAADSLDEARAIKRLGVVTDWTDIDAAQRQYRQASHQFVDAWRAKQLVRTFEEVLGIVEEVATKWGRQLAEVKARLIHKSGDSDSSGILNELQKRYDAAEQNLEERAKLTTTSIGLAQSENLEGYQIELFNEFVGTLVRHPDTWIDGAKWVLPTDEQGKLTGEYKPLLRLPNLEGFENKELKPENAIEHIESKLKNAAEDFLETKTVWDYFKFWVEKNSKDWQEVGRILRQRNTLMLDGKKKNDPRHKPRLVLLYNNRGLAEGIRWADRVRDGVMENQPGLPQLGNQDIQTISSYPNRWAIGLFQSIAFDAEDVSAFRDMREEYLVQQTLLDTDTNWMPYTYHTLRGLQVAFDIERKTYHQKPTAVPQPTDLIHPVLARALRAPHYTWFFFRLLAFDVIDTTPNKEWCIKELDDLGNFLLTNKNDGILTGDLIVAMSRFCIQQKEHANRNRPLTLDGLRSRYDKALQEKGISPLSKEETKHLEDFANTLPTWLEDRRSTVVQTDIAPQRRHPDLLISSIAKVGQYMLSIEEKSVLD